MADPVGRLLRIGDWGLDVPVPNPGLQAWLNSDEARVALGKIAREVQIAYQNYLPRRTGNLKGGAFNGTKRMKYPGQSERYYAWVGNRALSYRKTEGQPYPRFIEYGKENSDGTRTGGGYQLRNAALLVARGRGAAAYSAAKDYLGGEYNPDMHLARPAITKERTELNRRMAQEDPVRRAARKRRENAQNMARRMRSEENLRRAKSNSKWGESPYNPQSSNYNPNLVPPKMSRKRPNGNS